MPGAAAASYRRSMSRRQLRNLVVLTVLAPAAFAGAGCAEAGPDPRTGPGGTSAPAGAQPEPSRARCTAPAASLPDRTPARPSGTAAAAPGDGPPNHADNRRHLQRRVLTERQRGGAEACAAEVRTALDALRGRDVYDGQSVQAALTGVGLLLPSSYPVPSGGGGVVFWAYPEQGVCVYGEHAPRRTVVEVGGSTGEGACITP